MTNPFARALAAEMEARGISQSQLAPRLGVSQPTMSNWVGGRYTPDAIAVVKIETELGLVPGQLLRHLGLPLMEVAPVSTIPDAIAASNLLKSDKEFLLACYGVAAIRVGHRNGRSKAS